MQEAQVCVSERARHHKSHIFWNVMVPLSASESEIVPFPDEKCGSDFLSAEIVV